jgi:AraC-like DNA-binding protein
LKGRCFDIINNLDLEKASYNLSQLEIKIHTGNLIIDVNWFRRAYWSGKWVINRHSHSSYEFHFISSGRCRVILDDYEFTVNTGEFYINKPGVSHIQRNINGEEHSEYCLCCDLNLLDEGDSEELYILKIFDEVSCGPVKDIFGIRELFEKALAEAYKREIGFYNNIKGLVIMIVFSAAKSIAKEFKVKYQIPVIKHKNDNRLLQIEKYIEDNLTYPITVSDLAEHIHISEKQLCRIFAETKGMSTKQYIKKSKLKKAKDLLKTSDISIKEIASLLGFSSEYYFSQYFKREEGYPPGTFRKNTQNV